MTYVVTDGLAQLDPVPYSTGGEIWVDAVYGNDTSGRRCATGAPFKTIAAAMAVAQANDVVHVRPGVYVTAPFTMPANVTLAGTFPLRTRITHTAVANSTTLVTMSEGSVIRSIKLQLLQDGTPRTPLVGVLYGGSLVDSFLQDVHIEVDNSNAPTGTDVCGVKFTTTGTTEVENSLYDVSVDVNSPGTGMKRGIHMTSASPASVNISNVDVDIEGVGSNDVVGVETSGTGTLRFLTGRVGVTAAGTVNSDISQTAGVLRIGNVNLQQGSVNGKSFTVSNQLGVMVFSDSGALTATSFLQAGGSSAGTPTETIATFVVTRKCVVQTMYAKVQVAPGGTNTNVFTLRKNGADTSLTTTITGAALTNSDVVHAVEYAAGDTICVRQVTAASSAVNCQVTVEMSAW